MQFGIGLLGNGWTLEGKAASLLSSRAKAHPNFRSHAHRYAAKIAKETILSDNYSTPDLSDEGIVRRCAGCAKAVRLSEAPMVREAFLNEYSDYAHGRTVTP